MSIDLYDTAEDKVIKSTVGIGKTNYRYALDHLCPLVDRLDIQRNTLSSKMYSKMQEDIVQGAILPPITLAFVKDDVHMDKNDMFTYVNENIARGFVLDGIQRLSAIKRIYDDSTFFEELNLDTPLYVNIVISPNKDTLLYRMITLNNGQKPMSPRHQIEALYDYSDLEADTPFPLHTEKGQTRARSKGFKKSDIIKGYISYFTKSYNIDNQKLIESKMDELLVSKIIDNKKEYNEQEFVDVLKLIERLSENDDVYKWFGFENNMIGFCAAIRVSFNEISQTSPEVFYTSVQTLENYFNEYLDRSKIKIGTERRKAVFNFISNYRDCFNLDVSRLNDYFMDKGYI